MLHHLMQNVRVCYIAINLTCSCFVAIVVLQSFQVEVIRAQNVSSVLNKKKGCHLSLDSSFDEMEPDGDPLLLNVKITVLHLRDVPDSGGSFDVDIK